jgi:hypothetical protein
MKSYRDRAYYGGAARIRFEFEEATHLTIEHQCVACSLIKNTPLCSWPFSSSCDFALQPSRTLFHWGQANALAQNEFDYPQDNVIGFG